MLGAIFSEEGVSKYGEDVHADQQESKDVGHIFYIRSLCVCVYVCVCLCACDVGVQGIHLYCISHVMHTHKK